MNAFGRGLFSGLPPVVKNIILINVIMLFALWTADTAFNFNLNAALGLYYPESEHFRPYQIITHMFMHGGFTHIFFNMFAVFMFGRILEQVWGPKRFFIYYIITGIGAALTHEAVMAIQYQKLVSSLDPQNVQIVLDRGAELWQSGRYFTNPEMQRLNSILNIPVVGASGAVFGILLAFGMLFPNTQLMLLFPPIPIKAKWLVIGYGALELYLAVTKPGSNIAHAAHLGGMIFGFILIKFWKKTTNTLY